MYSNDFDDDLPENPETWGCLIICLALVIAVIYYIIT